MIDTNASLDDALERVAAAARAHLEAVRAADGERDDDAVWNAYVALNNASREYDELLNDVFGEVTPWDLEDITAAEADERLAALTSGGEVEVRATPTDPYPHVISVRQRRDYRVPSVSALLRVAEEDRVPLSDAEAQEPILTVAEAVLELLQSGDSSLSMLDLPELEPLDGVVVVAEVQGALDLDEYPDSDGEAPFRLAGADRTVGRLDERSVIDLDDH